MLPQLARQSPPINHFNSRPNFCHPQVSTASGSTMLACFWTSLIFCVVTFEGDRVVKYQPPGNLP